jgi:hypothetical protein
MPIQIPVEGHLITLAVADYQIMTREVQVGRSTRTYRERKEVVREVPPRHDENSVRRLFAVANNILAQIDVSFDLRQISPVTVRMPSNSETVDQPGFHYLAAQLPARKCVSLLVVSKFSSFELGGESVEDSSVCIIMFMGDEKLGGKLLAHEFGHLLSLDHVPPKKEDIGKNPKDNYNLMFPGLSADNQLTEDQRKQAQQSRLARQFGEASQ